MWRLIIYLFVLIWSVLTLPNCIKRYEENKDKFDLIEIISKIILIPSAIILIIACFID